MFSFRRHRSSRRSSQRRSRQAFLGRAASRYCPLRLEVLEPRLVLAAAVPADLVSWYRAEGDATDSAGGNDGVLENRTTFTAGKVGQAFLFDGVDDLVRVPRSDSQNPGSNFTIEAWVNPSSSGHGRPIAEKRVGNDNAYTFETTHAPYAPNDGLQFVVWINEVQQNFLQTPPGVLQNNTWQHVAATYDGAALRIFVDGVERASSAVSGAIDVSDAPVAIGLNTPALFAWHGAIDEISFYSRALSQAEIQSIVAAGSEGKDPDAALTVTTTADSGPGSLRAAIEFANANPGLDEITFNIPQPATDLVSWWRADGNANDAIENNDGTLQNGAGFAAGQYGQAFHFDGVDDSVDLGTWFNLQTFTIDMWVKPGTSQTAHANIIDSNHTGARSWEIQQNGSNLNQYVWGVQDGGGPSPVLDLAPDVWQHIAVTRDGASRVSNAYVNGSLVGSQTGTGDIAYDGSQFLRLGRWGGGGRNWNGELDEVRIFTRALSAAEVQANATEAPAIDKGPLTIQPTSALPTITDPVSIDGYTQPGASPNTLADGNNAVILIELDGSLAGDEVSGLVLTGGGSTIRGLAINRFSDSGIELRSGDNEIEGNFLGTDVTGTQALGNHEGVTIIGPEEIDPLYSNDFESVVGEEWSASDTDDTPVDGRRFLGQFGSETVTLSLDADSIDQDIDVMTVSFDLLVIRTWDGNHAAAGSGPDRFTLTLGDGTTLLDTTFSNGHPNSAAAGQAFPGGFGMGQFDPRTDAAENNTLGFMFPGVDVMDSVYRLRFTFTYTGGDLVLNLTGALTSAIDDESWGLDNVVLIEGEPAASVQGNRIGGTSPAEQNIVAFSSGDGIRTDGDDINAVIVGNSIFSNGADGIDFDDQIIDAPEILSLTSFPGELSFVGSLAAEPSTTYRIEIFSSDSAAELNDDEGQYLLGVRQVTTDASGHASFIHELPPVADGQWITATATRIDGDGESLLATSEFSEAVPVGTATLADLEVAISDSPDPVFIGELLTYTITVTNHGPEDASGVVVTASAPGSEDFNSVMIPLGVVPTGESRVFQIQFTPTGEGSFTAVAGVIGAEDDPNASNNSDTESTLVQRPIPPITIELASATLEVSEGQTEAVLVVTRTGPLNAGTSSIDFTTVSGTAGARGIRAGLTRVEDYTTTSGTLFVGGRQDRREIRIPIRDDAAIEGDETFQIVLSNPSENAKLGPIAVTTVTLHDNDPSISFVASSSGKVEPGGRGQIHPINLVLSNALSRSVSVQYAVVGGSATAGQDFRPASGTVTFLPRQTTKTIPLELLHDTLFEGDETILIELTSPAGAFLGEKTRHRVTITDNDPQPPPIDPGSTPATALAIDLKTLPRQSYEHTISRTDVDMFMVELAGGERLALDVDPAGLGTPLPNSTLVIRDDAGRVAATVGASAEPQGGVVTNNAATLFQADADGGTYFIQLTTTAGARSYPYSLAFHRIGVSENVPHPELLNVSGPMYAWFDGDRTVGITGPTGYGFTLVADEGSDWQQQVSVVPRTSLRSQTLTLNVGSQFTLRSPQGVELPLIANEAITIGTKTQRWGDVFGVVTTSAINFPVSLSIVPLNDLLADVFGSEVVAVGALTGQWRISLGGQTRFRLFRNEIAPVEQMLAGVPYLRHVGSFSGLTAQVGEFTLGDQPSLAPIDWILDPADPMLYVRVDQALGALKDPGLAISMNGLLQFKPSDEPNPEIDAGVTKFFGHIFAVGKIMFKLGPAPMEIDADTVINLDADRDGEFLAGLATADDFYDILTGDFSQVRDIVHDIQLGSNGRLDMVIDVWATAIKIGLGNSSIVVNGLEETIWVRSEQENPMAGTPLADAFSAVTGVFEGMVNWDGDFLFAVTADYGQFGAHLIVDLVITHEGISAQITGRIEWSATIDYLAGTVSGKAIAEISGRVEIDFDDLGHPHLSGSIDADGKLTAKVAGSNKTLFSGNIEAMVRRSGFRFRFPRGVGSLDLDIFI